VRKILLMGNPNVGKSVFFSRLTGAHVVSSNYPGTTVSFTTGHLLLPGGEKAQVIDVPGTYTLRPTCKAEDVACDMLNASIKEGLKRGDLVINVVDATNLERNLSLTLELMEQGIPVIVALNLWDDTKHRGIDINLEKLEKWLGVPVVPTVAVTGEGFRRLILRISEAKTPRVRKHTVLERWEDIGKVISEVQTISHRHHTLLEHVQDLTIKPYTGLPAALFIAYLSYKAIRFIGEGLIGRVFEPFFERICAPALMKLSALLGGGGLLHDILVGRLFDGRIDFVQSFGLLTTGLFVPLAMVLPYVFAFYLVLGILEDSGYLPRLSVLLDNLMHRVGLHGFAIVPTLLGFGCNVPGVLATRILESRRERFIASTLISIAVPCAALQAMIIGVLGDYGGRYVLIVYGSLALSWVVLGIVMNRFVSGFSPELLLEIPPYRYPPVRILIRKLWWRVKGFVKEALPVVLAGVFIVNLLYSLNVFDFISNITAPVVTGLLGLPKEAVSAIVIGFLRKDVAVGMFAPLDLTLKQLVVGCVVLSMFFPCVATFTVLLKELGWKDMMKSTAIMIAASLSAGALLNFILRI